MVVNKTKKQLSAEKRELELETKLEAVAAAELLLAEQELLLTEESKPRRKPLAEFVSTLIQPRKRRPFCGECGRLYEQEVKK